MFSMKQKSGFVILIVALAFTGGTRLAAAMDGTKPVPPGVYAEHGTGAEMPKGYVPDKKGLYKLGKKCRNGIDREKSYNIRSTAQERKKAMTTGKALDGKPYAGNPHVRFDEGEVASPATPRRVSLLSRNR